MIDPEFFSITRTEKIALVQPRLEDGNYLPSIGLMMLASVLLREGFSVRIFDENISVDWFEQLVAFSPQIVGFTAVTSAIDRCAAHATKIHNKLPQSLIVVGGPHVNALPKETLTRYSAFSYAFSGECEQSFPQFCKEYFKDTASWQQAIPNLVWRSSADVIHNKSPGFASDETLDSLPFPAWHLLPLEKVFKQAQHGLFSRGTRIMPVMTTRGCPNYCGFCARNMGFKLRSHSVERTLQEIAWLYNKFHIDELYFEDDTFTQDRERALAILNGIAELHLPIYLKFANGLRADKVDRELLEAMKRAGVYWIGFGIESGAPETLKLMMKHLDLKLASKNVALAKEMGFYVGSNCIIGYPGESKDSIRQSLRFFLSLKLDSLAIVNCVPFPGTTAWQVAVQNKWLTSHASNYANYWFRVFRVAPLIETSQLSAKDLQRYIMLAYLLFYCTNLKRFQRIVRVFLQLKWLNLVHTVRLLRANSFSSAPRQS